MLGHSLMSLSAMPAQNELNPQTTTLLRWLAMSIAAVAEDKRGVQYLTVRNSIAASIERFGIKGEEAEECLARYTDIIRNFVREIDAIANNEADAA
jgi:hypothetical protein